MWLTYFHNIYGLQAIAIKVIFWQFMVYLMVENEWGGF